tara:strand:- start:1340 stop:2071 length:732 start_codon:yes stop_codon:yes gene_type:complete
MKFITLLILKFFDSFHKKKILNFFKNNEITKLDNIIDIGGHKGESIIFFLKNFKIDNIYSFEPSPINFSNLKKNIDHINKKFNSLKKTNIIIENLALGDKNGNLHLNQFVESSSSSIKEIDINNHYFKKKIRFLNLKNEKNLFKKYDINITRLSDYMSKKKLTTIDLVKIDTEGYEYEILKGAERSLKNVKIILFEHHYDRMIKKNYKFRDIHSLLKKNSFVLKYKSKMPFRKTFEYIFFNNK